MKILLLGGTGAMGVHLAKILAEDNHEVFVTSRKKKENKKNITYIKGNAHDNEFINSILVNSWDVIIDFMIYSTAIFEKKVDVFLNSTKQYIFLSSARVYAESKMPIKESSPRLLDVSNDAGFLSTDEYALTKARQENLLFSSDKKNWTIIRPYITYNEERLQLGVLEKEAWLYRALNRRAIAFSKETYNKLTTLTYGLDVAKGIVAILGENKAYGEAFHITNEKSILWEDVYNIYHDVLLRSKNIDIDLVLQDFADFNKWHKASYQLKYDRFYNREFNNEKISQFIDVSTFVEPRDGLKKCLETFISSPKFLSINWNSEALKDRQLGVYTPLSEISNIKQKIKYFLIKNINF